MIVDQGAAGFKLSAEARSVSDVLALATRYGTGRQVELTAADPGLDVLINADILGCIAPFADGEIRRLAHCASTLARNWQPSCTMCTCYALA